MRIYVRSAMVNLKKNVLVLLFLYCSLISYTSGVDCPPGFDGTTCKKQNIALNKPTYQSSTYSESNVIFASSLAVDNNTNTDFGGLSCSTTFQGSPAHWSVTLDPVLQVNITNVTIFLRNNNGQRYPNFSVSVESETCKKVNIIHVGAGPPSPNPVMISGCDRPLKGHIVSVHVDNGILTLCEVQIWECVDGWFGEDCEHTCNCLNTDDVCDKKTGYCRDGCARGWHGDGCQTECVDGFFGTCEQRCNCQNSIEVCDKASGLCATSGCKIGTHEPDCQTACRNNTYGDNCSLRCGQCKNSTPCDPVTGVCPSGCEAGWMSDRCDIQCNNGFFGTCAQRCNCEDSNEICNKVTGECSTSGCKLGTQKPDCQTACVDGFFGMCTQRCNCRDPGEICDKVSGMCSASGCKLGTYEPDCQTACKNKTYGENCSKRCGQCKNSAVCDPVTGRCSNGCEAGWKTDKCDVECDNEFFGTCAQRCNCQDSSEVCNKVTGMCSTSGCKLGTKEPDCQTECDDGFFGTCDKLCNCENSLEVCEKATGRCQTSGCKQGTQAPDCQTACKNNTYGANCSKRCGQCRDSAGCDSVTGVCPSGCQDGWRTDKCDIETGSPTCISRKYGENCSKRCGQCKNSAPCDSVTGVCGSGCEAGWRTDKCDIECTDGTYGEGCTSSCGSCKDDSVCDKTTGNCTGGCASRYIPPLCKEMLKSPIGKLSGSDSSTTLMQALVGVVVIAAVAVLAVVVGALFCMKRKRRTPLKEDFSRPTSSEYNENGIVSVSEGNYVGSDYWWKNPQWNFRYPIFFRPSTAIALPYVGQHYKGDVYE